MLDSKSLRGNFKRVLILFIWISLVIYLILVFKVICLKFYGIEVYMNRLFTPQTHRSVNIVPFNTIRTYIFSLEGMSQIRRIGNIVGNIGLFFPFGLLIPLIIKHKRKNLFILIIAFGISLSFEVLQYFSALGAADIDDLILNVLGAYMGLLAYRILTSVLKREIIQILAIFLLFIQTLLAGFYFARREFALDLNLFRDSNISFEPRKEKEDLNISDLHSLKPVSECSLMGNIELLSGDTIYINKWDVSEGKSFDKGSQNSQILIIHTIKNKDALDKILLTDSSFVLCKDIIQYSSTQFDVSYSESCIDSIKLNSTAELWLNMNNPKQADTIVFWITYKK